MKHKTNIPSVLAPRGCHWHVNLRYDNEPEIQLRNRSNDIIGRINLSLVKLLPVPRFETHSYLDSFYQGKGWGTKLYAKAIQWCLVHGFKVSSSTSPSDMAKRVWKSDGLRQLFMIRQVKVKTPGYPPSRTPKVWNAYAKPQRKAAKRKTKRYAHQR